MMEVLPRPNPKPPNRVYWEFLIYPHILEDHLKDPNPDPPSQDLLLRFMALSVELPKEDYDVNSLEQHFKCTQRQICQKMLSLKIFALWRWNLIELQKGLPVQLQYALLRDFLCSTTDIMTVPSVAVPLSHVNLDYSSLTEEQIFAITLFHIWCVDICVTCKILPKNLLIDVCASWNVETTDVILQFVTGDVYKIESVLQKILDLNKEFFKYPTFYCFIPPTVDTNYQTEWNYCEIVPGKFINCCVLYHLASLKFYREQYAEASVYFRRCNELFVKIRNSPDWLLYSVFCQIDEAKLKGYCLACGIDNDENDDIDLDFYENITKHYASDAYNILQKDNAKRVIPLSFRNSLEMDLLSMVSCGKFTASRELILQVQTFNAMRRMLEGASFPTAYDFALKLNVSGRRGVDVLSKILRSQLNTTSLSKEEIGYARAFMSILVDKVDSFVLREMIAWKELKVIFSDAELGELKSRLGDDSTGIVSLTNTVDAKTNKTLMKIRSFGNSKLELRALEYVIVHSYSFTELYDGVSKYVSMMNDRSVNFLDKWEIHVTFQNIIKNLPNQFLQQFSFIIFAKSKQLLRLQNYAIAEELLELLDEEIKKYSSTNALYKLSQLITWEILLVNVVEWETKYPAKHINIVSLVNRCKLCMATLQQTTEINAIPRLEVMEQIIITLLNLGEWDFIANGPFQKTFRFLEIAVEIARSCNDIHKSKGAKKLSAILWEKVLSAFVKNPQWQERENMNTIPRPILIYFLLKLRDPVVITVVLSLLVKLLNCLRDETTPEVNFYHINLWSETVSNVSSFNKAAVTEVLFDFTKQALRYHPTSTSWLKLMADLNYVHSNYEMALQYYIEAMIVGTDYFTRPSKLHEDYICKVMSRCCAALHCYTQAGVLCQYWDDSEHVSAFKYLSEINTRDAKDLYFDCIWDMNMLEYVVYTHAKRNEHYVTHQLADLIGQLELNVANNEEIKREAANSRKYRLFRALTKQYVNKLC